MESILGILRLQNSFSLNYTPAPISLNSEACFFGSDEIANKSLRQGFSCYELLAEFQSLALHAKNNFRDYCFNLLNNSEKACFFGSDEIANKSLRQGFSCCELSAEFQSLALNAKNNFRDYCFNLLNNSEKACFFGSEANGNKTKNKRQFV